MNETYPGIFGGGEFLAFLIFAIIFGNGGWGLGGNRGIGAAGAVIADQSVQSQLSNIQDQLSTNRIESTLGTINNGMVQGFAGLNNAVTSGFANQTNNMNLGFSGLNTAINQGFAAQALQGNQNTQSIINAICGLSSKLDANTIAELSAKNAALRSKVDNANQSAMFTAQINSLSAQLAECCCKLSHLTTTTTAA